MTDLEGRPRHSTAGSGRGLRLLVRVFGPVLVVVAPLSIALPSAGSASASQLTDARAQAAQLEQEIQSTGQQIDALDQTYQAALAQKASDDHQITVTQAEITTSDRRIAKDRAVMAKAAVQAYVDGGSATTENPLFSGSQTSAIDSTVYNQVVTGNLSTAVDDLHIALTQLDSQRQTLRAEDAQAAQAVSAAQAAYQQAQTLEAQQEAALSQVKGQIATLVAQQQQAAAVVAEAAAQAQLASAQRAPSSYGSSTTAPPPPPASGTAGAIAVRAAESQLGVPYVWGGETPGVGFDCSGLTAWAWGQAGVYLPHYSGAQMADSTPVPVSDLQPGDLLFYGPGGSQHVAMYVGGGMMIEAPFTGTVVRIDPIRLGTGFAGAGRP